MPSTMPSSSSSSSSPDRSSSGRRTGSTAGRRSAQSWPRTQSPACCAGPRPLRMGKHGCWEAVHVSQGLAVRCAQRHVLSWTGMVLRGCKSCLSKQLPHRPFTGASADHSAAPKGSIVRSRQPTRDVRVDCSVEQLHAALLVLQSDAVLLVVAVGQEVDLRGQREARQTDESVHRVFSVMLGSALDTASSCQAGSLPACPGPCMLVKAGCWLQSHGLQEPGGGGASAPTWPRAW